jgi:glycosyltransferase involved in cell wall biosynthesis
MKIAELIIGDINRLTGGYLYDRKLVEYLTGNGIEVDVISIREVPYPYILHLFSNLSLILRFFRRHRSYDYDFVLEDEMAHPALFLFNFWLRYVKRAKIVVIVHLLWWKAAKGWKAHFVRSVEKIMLKNADLIIANSKHTKEEIEGMGIPGEFIEVVYPGFDLPLSSMERKESYHTHKGDSIKLLSVANCSPLKGLDTLIAAIHRLDNPGIALDVVGDDNFDPNYCKIIKEKVLACELEKRVIFHGLMDPKNLSGFYSEADIFVLPPFYEPLGIVFAEAMSFGLPIIATNVGGIPELVADGENGLLVPPGDIDSLADAIDKLASDAELRERFGRSGYEKSKKLNTWADCGEVIFQYLQQIEEIGERGENKSG